MTALPLKWGTSPVPWVAAWSPEASREAVYVRTETIGGNRLRFMCDGIDTPGEGRPVFKIMHLERSRHVVAHRLCQICCEPLPASSICMNQGEREGFHPLINDGLPMCEPCASLSIRHCPGLKRAAAAGRLHVFRASDWDLAPVILGPVPEAKGGCRRVNELLAKERGPVFGYVKLVLRRFSTISPDAIAEAA
ncbi:hypothetical protein JL101_035695 (plasmid) [Skermanella rosea]|uniref:hypothetical protein n=1 Tax=Skermanella rosea TaxID=1817965 RepID=UPI0019347253|nr:hypothetical protein [Skermanella rosea]UEM07996.1 hypothetical protein JL101_035695 [Skermanella rosea]